MTEQSRKPTHPVHFVVDPEGDRTWVAATIKQADDVYVTLGGQIVAVQIETFTGHTYDPDEDGTHNIKRELHWVLGDVLVSSDLVGKTVLEVGGTPHTVRTIQDVLAEAEPEPEDEEDEPTFEVRRYFRDSGYETVKTGLTREEAEAHCNDPETSSSTATSEEAVKRTAERGPWFDGFTQED